MEVMFSIGILSIASLGVMSVLTYGMMTADTAGDFSTANQLSREISEVIKTNRTTLLFGSANPASPTPAAGLAGNTKVAYNAPLNTATPIITMAAPENAAFTRTVSVSYPAQNFAKVQVRVFWFEKGDSLDTDLGGGTGAVEKVEKNVETIFFVRSGRPTSGAP